VAGGIAGAIDAYTRGNNGKCVSPLSLKDLCTDADSLSDVEWQWLVWRHAGPVLTRRMEYSAIEPASACRQHEVGGVEVESQRWIEQQITITAHGKRELIKGVYGARQMSGGAKPFTAVQNTADVSACGHAVDADNGQMRH